MINVFNEQFVESVSLSEGTMGKRLVILNRPREKAFKQATIVPLYRNDNP